jgi:hypothetical protein
MKHQKPQSEILELHLLGLKMHLNGEIESAEVVKVGSAREGQLKIFNK